MRVAIGWFLVLVAGSWVRAGDLEDLQGYWVSLDDPWSLEIKGDVATFHGTYPFVDAYQGKQDGVELRFSLVTDAIPRQFNVNEDDLKAANERLKAKYKRSRGIYRLHGDQLTLQFAWGKHLPAFDHWEGAPSNHARPLSRRLRRVSPEELKLLKSLSGVWRGEIRQGKQTVQIETMYILPGWLKGLQQTPATRLQLLTPLAADGKQQLVIHTHFVTRGTGLFGGSFTTHYWLAGSGTAAIEPGRVITDVDWLFKDKRLNEDAFQTKLALDWDNMKEIREYHPQYAGQFPGPLQLVLTKVADEIPFKYGSLPSSPQYTPVPEDVLSGEWRVLLHKTARPAPNANGPAKIEYTPDPEKGRWTFSAGRAQFVRDGKAIIRLLKPEKDRPNWFQTFLESEPDRSVGWLNLQYESEAKLLRLQLSERIDEVFVNSFYVLERLPPKETEKK